MLFSYETFDALVSFQSSVSVVSYVIYSRSDMYAARVLFNRVFPGHSCIMH